MTTLQRLERDRSAAELASIERLLSELSDEDVMARLGLEDRRNELVETLAVTPSFEGGAASVALFFGGKPVAGQRGIESEFAGNAVTQFQDLVAKLMTTEVGDLGQRGPVPNKRASTMHITNVVRGSFGFLLEELNTQGQLIDSALNKAVSDASRLMVTLGTGEEAEFQSIASDVDQRILSTAMNLYSLFRENEATVRLVTSDMDVSLTTTAIALGLERATLTHIEERTTTIKGQLLGTLPEGHMFEFRTKQNETIRGRIDRAISVPDLIEWNSLHLNKDVEAEFLVRHVYKGDDKVRIAYVLRSLGIKKLKRLA